MHLTTAFATVAANLSINHYFQEDFEAEDDNDDDEPTSGGTFQRASADVLAGRKIVKIKRFALI